MFAKIILSGLVLTGTMCVADAQFMKSNEAYSSAEVRTDELKTWVDENKEMILVDARSEQYFDGSLLPSAVWLPYDAPEQVLEQALPSKDSLIVVYCKSDACPASQYMVDRLMDKGYTSVYKYKDGLQDWKEQGLPMNQPQEAAVKDSGEQ